MSTLRTAAQQALECLKGVARGKYDGNAAGVCAALEAALAQQAEQDAYGYASRIAVSIWQWHYKDTAPNWKPLDDLMGVLTQIDNMTSGLTRRAQQAEPVVRGAAYADALRWTIKACGAVQRDDGVWFGDDAAARLARVLSEGIAPPQQAEPVAWMLTDAQNPRVRFLEWQKETRAYSGEWIKTPLYTAPPQQAEPARLKRGITGRCTRKVCECEKEGLGPECIYLEPVIDGYPLWSGIPKAEPVPFGWVTVRRLSLRHENHADQYQFYPAGQSPYLDNVDECHTVYIIPPQRKPLTDEEILQVIGWERAEMYMKLTPNFPVDEAKKETLKNARAIERAHGIGRQSDPQVEDRLARHGIPMPEVPPCPDCHGIGYDASGQTCACQENPSF